jgi:uncharacterized protein YcbX
MTRVLTLYRYPVKSLLGEQLDEVVVDSRGCAGDRLWSVRDPDGKLGSGKSTRRFRRMDGLLELSATYDGDVPVLTFPDGRELRAGTAAVERALSAHVGRPVTLDREGPVSHFDEGPLHLVSTASLQTLARAHGRPVDPRRTRANLILEEPGEGFPEHDWVGRRLRIGPELVVMIRSVMPRCVMVNSAHGALTADDRLLRTITDLTEGALGVVADVERRGVVRVGDGCVLL